MTSFTEGEVLALVPWPVAALALARVAPVFVIAPFFGGGGRVPLALRLAMAAAVALLLAPALRGALPAGWDRGGPAVVVLLAAREAAVGALLGLLVSVPFYAAEGAGALAQDALGSGVARSPSLADLSLLLTVVVFFAASGHLLFVRALGESYRALPPAAALDPAAVSAAGDTAVRATAQLVLATLGLAAPVLVARVLAEVVVGLGMRATPAGAALQPLRSLVVLGVYMLSLGALALALRGELARALADVGRAVRP